MELMGIFTTAFVVGFSGAMMPGPLLTFAIGESARRGFMVGPLLILGHGLLEIALILAIAGGLAGFLTRAEVSGTIAVVGGIFLFYMGYGMVKDSLKGKVSLDMPDSKKNGATFFGRESDRKTNFPENIAAIKRGWIYLVVAGVFISISNPYWTIWWATVGLGYITLSLRNGLIGLASFFTGHILADLVWYSLVAAAVAGGRKFLSDSVYQGVLVACGIFLAGLGGYFLYYGIFT
ncbi:MAG: LysE family transporter [Desulfotomaculaceae bacterium]|nr:LysE family transporter [Desulfotomaculaceae bacterium]